MEQTQEEIIQRITLAFNDRELSEGDPVFLSNSLEVDTQTFKKLINKNTWIDCPLDVLCDNPQALAFMTPKAFAWFLPACLVASVARYCETGTLTTSLITYLTPPDETDAHQFDELVEEIRVLDPNLIEEDPVSSLGADDELTQFFTERADLLTQAEKMAVRDYLIYIDNMYGIDFPAFGPKQALARYWSAV